MESILKNSFFYNLILTLVYLYKNSCVARSFARIGYWYSCSSFHKRVSAWIRSESRYQYSLAYRLASYVGNKLDGIISRFHKVFSNYLESSIFASVDYSFLVYLLALYVFIDYTFRSLLGIAVLASYWDELFFAACIFFWFCKWIFVRGEKAYRWTPLDFPIFTLIGTDIFLLFINSPDFNIGVEGLRAFVQHILWYFVVIQLVRDFKGAKKMYKLLVIVCCIVGFYGVVQFLTGVETPVQWVDQAEKAVTRVYSIVKSPNILGSLMVLAIPMGMALFFATQKIKQKVVYLGLSAIMVLALILTSSRGAWIGFAFAMVIYFLQRDKRRYLPLIVLCAALVLLIPPVWSRIDYLLSPEYIQSSLRGGRLNRLPIGLKMFRENLWVGVGLGRFGGAVAANNNIEGTFYMDNYYLKTAVETGIAGLGAFLLLIFNVVLQSYRTIKRSISYEKLQLALGALAGMSGVLVHNMFENVFEVPMMVAYFWMTAGFVMLINKFPSGLSQEQ